jgi:hypothetical protein
MTGLGKMARWPVFRGKRSAIAEALADMGRACAARKQETPRRTRMRLLVSNGLQQFRYVCHGQAQSNRIKPAGLGVGCEWTVDSGQWPVGEDCPVKPSQTQSNQSHCVKGGQTRLGLGLGLGARKWVSFGPVKPSQTQSSRSGSRRSQNKLRAVHLRRGFRRRAARFGGQDGFASGSPPHEHASRREPPHPDPLLHKCVEEREMERCARVLGINARNSLADSRHEHKSKREPPHPGPLLHKCVEEREMERGTRVLGIHARNSSANPVKPSQTQSNQCDRKSGQTSLAGGSGGL